MKTSDPIKRVTITIGEEFLDGLSDYLTEGIDILIEANPVAAASLQETLDEIYRHFDPAYEPPTPDDDEEENL